MKRRVFTITTILVLALAATSAAFADGHSGPPGLPGRIYVDGEQYATNGLTELPAPNENNEQSFDKLYVFSTGVDGQIGVGEAAPGDTDFNGGRWDTQTVDWNVVPVLVTSEEQLLTLEAAGDVTITDGGSDLAPDYFECPVVPLNG